MAARTLTIDLLNPDDMASPGFRADIVIVRTDTDDPTQTIYTSDAKIAERYVRVLPNARGRAEVDLIPNSETIQPTQYELWISLGAAGNERTPFVMPDADTTLTAILTGSAPPAGNTFYLGASADRTLAGQSLITALTGGTIGMSRDPIAVPTLAANSFLFFAQPQVVSDPTGAFAHPSAFNQIHIWEKRAGTIQINSIEYEVWVTRVPQNQAESGRNWRFT